MFIDRLIDKIVDKNNPTVLGLDPQIQYVPQSIKNKMFLEYGKNSKAASLSILEFNKRIIDSVSDIIGVVKLQLAYYEMYGIEGMKTFLKTIEYAKSKNLIVIGDGKRNDIGSTANSYSNAFLGKTKIDEGIYERIFDVDSLTVNPYLGVDGIEPFIKDCKEYNKGIFVLLKTSNESSGELQDIITADGRKIYELMADYISNWGSSLTGKYGYSSVGAVVGATYPEQATELRKVMKNSFWLVPGYGAQGGTSKDVANSFNEDGLGAIINASRSIMCAYKSDKYSNEFTEEQFDEAARKECLRMKEDLNNVIGR